MDQAALIIVGVAVMAVLVVVSRRVDQRQAFHAQAGVVARFSDLAVSQTELLQGWGATVQRRPLAGWSARAEDAGDGRSVYVLLTGPGESLTRQVPIRRNDRAAGLRARAFAQAVNLYAGSEG